MKREPGDERVALAFAAVSKCLASAVGYLTGGREHEDRCIDAMEEVASARILLNGALCDLEALTEIPFTAIPIDASIGRGPAN